MLKFCDTRCFFSIAAATFLAVGVHASSVRAQNRVYSPIPVEIGKPLKDTLSDKDIPTGQGGFGRDYILTLSAGDQIAIDLTSESFDTIVSLLSDDGSTIGENDDGPDGTTNSLLFMRIPKSGNYIIRVRGFGETAGGSFTLKVTRLRSET
ncbi:MAG: hypothetical protein NVS2B14_08690 [Chamaesiphon sp.]